MLTAPIATPNPNRAPATGLIALAVTPAEVPAGWEGGLAFESETCSDGLRFSNVCEQDTSKAIPDDLLPGVTEYRPVTLVGFDACSTLSGRRASEDLARRHLLSVQSHQLELAFWRGEATDDEVTNGGDRPHLADGTATVLASGGATEVRRALALLDASLTDCLHGTQGMVHVTPYALAWLQDYLERESGRWLTANGHLVVAGSGYDGTGPRSDEGEALPSTPALGADQWAYATPMVTTLLGDIAVLDNVEVAVNTRAVRAERSAAAIHGGCCKFAVQLDIAA